MKISVITAVFNAKDTIADSIESTLNQTHPNVELVVIDGGSTDGTVEYLKSKTDKIAVFVSEPDKGIYDALNKGIKNSSGDVLGFLHADDLFADRSTLSKIAQAFEDPNVDAVYGDLRYISKSKSDKVIRYWKAGCYSREKLKAGWMPPHPTFYVRRAIYSQMGAFDVSFNIAADYDCMLRIISDESLNLHYIPSILVNMRIGGASNRSLRNIICKSIEDYRALKNNRIGGFNTLLLKNLRKVPQFLLRK